MKVYTSLILVSSIAIPGVLAQNSDSQVAASWTQSGTCAYYRNNRGIKNALTETCIKYCENNGGHGYSECDYSSYANTEPKDFPSFHDDGGNELWPAPCKCENKAVEGIVLAIFDIVAEALQVLDNLLCAIMLESFQFIVEEALNFVVPPARLLKATERFVEGAKSFAENTLPPQDFFDKWIGSTCGMPDWNFDVWDSLTGAPDMYGVSIGCKKKNKGDCKDPPAAPTKKPDDPPAPTKKPDDPPAPSTKADDPPAPSTKADDPPASSTKADDPPASSTKPEDAPTNTGETKPTNTDEVKPSTTGETQPSTTPDPATNTGGPSTMVTSVTTGTDSSSSSVAACTMRPSSAPKARRARNRFLERGVPAKRGVPVMWDDYEVSTCKGTGFTEFKYALDDEAPPIASGSDGTVYKGWVKEADGTGTEVAIKAGPSKEKLQHGAEIQIKLQGNPNVGRVYGHCASDGPNYFVIQELITGGTIMNNMEKLFKNQEVAVKATMNEILEGFTYIHSQGYAHEDIKGDNIILSGSLNAKIIDFDLATDQKTVETVEGSEQYRSPEGRKGGGIDAIANDVWALGILHVEMLNGARPWPEAMHPDAKKLWDKANTDSARVKACEDLFKRFTTQHCKLLADIFAPQGERITAAKFQSELRTIPKLLKDDC
ncbi:kinase-like domain-containing protein [Massariosphaeria phaeospora]|uniref:Kinase-like domain-containing protein n=1 Tax=Massariosphaeria phaeospora TaxID=100035 RepID=A0A7C8M4J1_9PLEO|nr:kinase-like domain-containing protein [Massariosphaeria phaeospora]